MFATETNVHTENLFLESLDSRTIVFPSDPDRKHSLMLLLEKTFIEGVEGVYRNDTVYGRRQTWTELDAFVHFDRNQLRSFILRGPLSHEDVAFMCFHRMLSERDEPESSQLLHVSVSDNDTDNFTAPLTDLTTATLQETVSIMTNEFVRRHSPQRALAWLLF